MDKSTKGPNDNRQRVPAGPKAKHKEADASTRAEEKGLAPPQLIRRHRSNKGFTISPPSLGKERHHGLTLTLSTWC